MSIKGIGIDYSNICKDYNTMYLDRDNTDRETQTCMKKVVAWMNGLLTDFTNEFEFNIYNMDSGAEANVDIVAANRFLFYSLEKDITLQNFIVQKEFTKYSGDEDWSLNNKDGILLKNDEEGEGVYFYFNDDSKASVWIKDRLKDLTWDEVNLNIK